MEVTEGLKINIIENEPGVDHTIILPPESGSLKDEELDQIAGGDFLDPFCKPNGNQSGVLHVR